ncbi:hypothetical protein [Vannielia litorea]|uniref:hypothetical protein n=1 Tax=Vannielia litorea TaxID=1217970 RepID=UPI001C950D45|nr:hypothetical protein [Vannielia litorea]MBY6049865.1 hypothetical protein [Vannielia litorea]MBY6077279.1 hypothetical protein [Vannielia litorea]
MSDRDELELRKLSVEIDYLTTGTRKLVTEILKLERERALYPVVVGTGMLVAFVGLFKLFS